MSIPDYQAVMLPLLQATADGAEYSLPSLVDLLADQFKLTQDERHALLPSGAQSVFKNRVGWARAYLKKACLFLHRNVALCKLQSAVSNC